MLFDRVICMTDGNVIYNGPPTEIANYFNDNFGVQMKKLYNPADFVINLAHHPEKYKKNLCFKQMEDLA